MDRQQRRLITQSIDKIAYDFQQFDLDHLIAHLQSQREHDITLVPYPFRSGVSGALVRGDGVYYIVFDSRVHPTHQMHIVLHEIAHMLLNHPLQKFSDIAPKHPLAQLGDAVRFRNDAERDAADEKEAEAFAQLFQQGIFSAERQKAFMGDLASSRWLNDYYKGMGL